jgi:hypothetical protein
MRRHLPSNRFRRIGTFAVLAALVALASIGLSAQAETPQQTQSQSAPAR